jgi:hypothetical protein
VCTGSLLTVGERELVEVPAGEVAEVAELGGDLVAIGAGEGAIDQRGEQAIGGEGVAELGRRLDEAHGANLPRGSTAGAGTSSAARHRRRGVIVGAENDRRRKRRGRLVGGRSS